LCVFTQDSFLSIIYLIVN